MGGGDVFFSLLALRVWGLEEPKRLSMCERSKATQGCVMSPWQVEKGAVLDVGEQRSSLRKRS